MHIFGIAGVDGSYSYDGEVKWVDFSRNNGLQAQDGRGSLYDGVVAAMRSRGVGLPAFDLETAQCQPSYLWFLRYILEYSQV